MATDLSTPQLQALKAAINAETDPAFVGYRTNGQVPLMRDWLNGAHPTEKAWNKAASWGPIFAAIDGSLYTPRPAQVNAATDATATKMLLVNLLKLTMQQNYLLAMQTVDAVNPDVRAALIDQVTDTYTLNGTNRTHPGGLGGADIAPFLARAATRAEVVFGGATSVTGGVTARTLTREGPLTDEDISAALAA